MEETNDTAVLGEGQAAPEVETPAAGPSPDQQFADGLDKLDAAETGAAQPGQQESAKPPVAGQQPPTKPAGQPGAEQPVYITPQQVEQYRTELSAREQQLSTVYEDVRTVLSNPAFQTAYRQALAQQGGPGGAAAQPANAPRNPAAGRSVERLDRADRADAPKLPTGDGK